MKTQRFFLRLAVLSCLIPFGGYALGIRAQTGTPYWKQCGDSGKDNAKCQGCANYYDGNTFLYSIDQGKAGYKVCQDTGSVCKHTVDVLKVCDGQKWDGKDCKGNKVGGPIGFVRPFCK